MVKTRSLTRLINNLFFQHMRFDDRLQQQIRIARECTAVGRLQVDIGNDLVAALVAVFNKAGCVPGNGTTPLTKVLGKNSYRAQTQLGYLINTLRIVSRVLWSLRIALFNENTFSCFVVELDYLGCNQGKAFD